MTGTHRLLKAGAIVTSLVALSCDTPTVVPEFDHATAHANYATTVEDGELSGLAKQVRQATLRFRVPEHATATDYDVASPCVAAPGLGGMGFHWVKNSLVDPVFDPLKPEAVLYEQNANGQLKLVAVEYIVINVGQPAPTFDGQPFDVGGTPVPVPHWSLHVWLFKQNPSGMFTPFNPDVVCL
jgi:hypothetical protein